MAGGSMGNRGGVVVGEEGDDVAGACGKLRTECLVVVVKGGDGGRGGRKAPFQQGALVGLVRQLLAEAADLGVPAGLADGGLAVLGDAGDPFGEDRLGAVHGGSADLGFAPEVLLGQPSVGAPVAVTYSAHS